MHEIGLRPCGGARRGWGILVERSMQRRSEGKGVKGGTIAWPVAGLIKEHRDRPEGDPSPPNNRVGAV